MENSNFLKNSQIVILGICIAIATIAASLILSSGLMNIKRFSTELIQVTGASEKKILSDYMVWKLDFSRRDLEMTGAYEKLKLDLKAIHDYLITHGVAEGEMIALPVTTKILYKKDEKGHDTNQIEEYLLNQTLEVRSYQVEKVTAVSREATELITQGIELVSNPPEYFYTKLPELKHELLSEASADAKKRAEQMAASTGSRIGTIRSARMGVFQITPVNSYDVSDWGYNDTTSLEKKANAVVKVDFSIVS